MPLVDAESTSALCVWWVTYKKGRATVNGGISMQRAIPYLFKDPILDYSIQTHPRTMPPKEMIGAGQGPKRCSKKTQASAPAPTPSLRPPPASTLTLTSTITSTGELKKRNVHGAQKSNGQMARASSSAQPAASASTPASSTKAAVWTSNQPSNQWKQRCLIVISGFMW